MSSKNENIRILMPLPSYGFDPSEAAIPYKLFKEKSFEVIFATPEGKPASADSIMLTGKGLGPFAGFLKARADALRAYYAMTASRDFLTPVSYRQVDPDSFDALFLPGGHDKGVREYLESPELQGIIPVFFGENKKVAAVCHGVILLARSIDPLTRKSVIYQRKTTSLLKSQELLAYKLTKSRVGDYYLTYPGTTVEDEVKAALKDPSQFVSGPVPVFRDRPKALKHGFAQRDGNYISARWPGDIYNLAFSFIEMLREKR